MTKTIKAQENNIDVTYVLPDDAPRFNTDGFGPALVGFPMTTVSLFQQQFAQDPSAQERKIVATIQFPTTALLELAQNIVATMRENSASVDATLEGIKRVLASKPV